MKTGEFIKQLRIKKGLTQEELADKTEISVRTIQRIESGDVDPRIFTLQSIADALGIEYEELISVEENDNINSVDKFEKNKSFYLFLLHISGIFDLIFPSVIVWLLLKDKVSDINKHAVDVLNFQISMFIYLAISGMLVFLIIGVPLAIFFGFYSVIVIIINSLKVINNRKYKYPLSIKFITKI